MSLATICSTRLWKDKDMRKVLVAILALLGALQIARADERRPWTEIVSTAHGQTVYWNAWAGDQRTNAYIQWVGEQVRQRYGVTVQQVKLQDTAEAVTRVVAEKTAGRLTGGTVDLIWINGPNFLSMKQQGLLYGPFTRVMPNTTLVDMVGKPSNGVDFTVPVDGLESPWRIAQVVYLYDSARVGDLFRSVPGMLDWVKRHPGRLTHPNVRNFLGVTFLKQALYELAADATVLQQPATDDNFAAVTAPLWVWYDALRPLLWRAGREFPENGPAAEQLLNDGGIDVTLAFDPAVAASSAAIGLLPKSARVAVLEKGTIGNTSFVAIPFNAAHKEGAMVVANFLLEPEAQARAQNIDFLGSFSVLDVERLPAADKKRFADLPKNQALPTSAELGKVLLEPHASWMTRIIVEYQKRYLR
jgi:putative thiamine transport system substrate-binding protein